MKKITQQELSNYIAEQALKLVKQAVLRETFLKKKTLLEKKLAIMEGRSYTVTFDYTDNQAPTPELNKTYYVTAEVRPGDSGSFYGGPDGVGSAPEPGEVDITSVIDLDTEQEVINFLSPELLSRMAQEAEEKDGGHDPYDRDDLDENTTGGDAKTIREMGAKYHIQPTGQNGKFSHSDIDKILATCTPQERYNVALIFANSILNKQIGLSWDDLADVNSLCDAAEEGTTGKEMFDDVVELCRYRLEETGGYGSF